MAKYLSKYYKLHLILFCLITTGLTFAKPKPIQSWYTPNGLKVMFLPAPELPMVDFRLLVKAGSSYDGNNSGLAYLTSSLLNQGTTNHSVDELAETFTNLGAQFSSSTSKDFTSIGLRTLTKKNILNAALKQWLEIIQAPSFPKDLITLKKEQQLTSIKFAQQQPGSVASREFYQLLYNKKIPYAEPKIGFTNTVSALTRTKIINFYKTHYSSNGAVLAIVGKINTKQAKHIALDVSKALPTNKNIPIKKWPTLKSKKHTKHINFPSTQTHILLGTLGIQRGAKDTFSLYVGNKILGGGWTSKLFQDIRVKQGLAYSVYSYFLPLKYKGPFLITLQTSNKTTQQALTQTKEILQKFTQQGPSVKEIDKAKRYISGNFPLRINSNSKKIGYIAMIGFYNLPLNYLDTFVQNINKVTKKDIQKSFKQLIDINKMTLVTVGNDSQDSNDSE